MSTKTFYDLSAKTLKGEVFNFGEKLRGKPVLIVNVASKCGLTPQYKGLEELYKKYKDQGFVILGFPCNQFMGQEPGGADQIESFCTKNYGVSFQMMEKIDVNGKNTHEVYQYLKEVKKPENPSWFWKVLGKTDDIKWNFAKFLVDKQGRVVGRYDPQTVPESFEEDIKKAVEESA